MVIVESLSKTETIEGIKYKYFYRLIKSSFNPGLQDDKSKVECFGIEVERHDIINNSIAKIERESIERISPYRHKVHSLLKFVNDNTVSPLHLVDILGEYVDRYILDFNDEIESFDDKLSESIMC